MPRDTQTALLLSGCSSDGHEAEYGELVDHLLGELGRPLLGRLAPVLDVFSREQYFSL